MADLEAGIGTLLRLRPAHVDLVLVVTEPSAKSIEVARRAVAIAASRAEVLVVANRIGTDGDLIAVREALDGHAYVVVPEEPAIAQADREGLAPIDVAPDAPGVRALVALADRVAGDGDAPVASRSSAS